MRVATGLTALVVFTGTLIGMSACGGSSPVYTEQQAVRAFAQQGIGLEVILRAKDLGWGKDVTNVEAILAPRPPEYRELGNLRLRLFWNDRLADDFSRDEYGRLLDGCRWFERTRRSAQPVFGCIRGNLDVQLSLDSSRLTRQLVERAVTSLS